MKSILAILFFLSFFPLPGFSQNQANNWYIGGNQAGLNFNSGVPITLVNGANQYYSDGGTAGISDTLGNILFYTDGETVWNRNHQIMSNGSGLEGDIAASQPALIILKPGSKTEYYLFTVGSRGLPRGLKYNIVDMQQDNGNGSVIDKNHTLNAATWARDKISAVKHSNGKDYWIITYDIISNSFYSFLLTSVGISATPIISSSKIFDPIDWYGPLKVSQDSKKLVSCNRAVNAYTNGSFEICDFNNSTGKITSKFTVKENFSNTIGFAVTGVEMSPDSKLLYVTAHLYPPGPDNNCLIQYDLTQADSLSFLNSGRNIDTTARTAGLQLAPDGKIYGVRFLYPNNDTGFYYLDVIHDVWKRGTDCNFQSYAVSLNNRTAYSNLPNFPQDLLYRFVWSGGLCAGVPFNFRHRFIPEPDSIHWDFGDAGSGAANTSTVHNPTHVFSAGGTYEVYTYVKYPNGRIEETSREVEVLAKPYPNLGPDTLVCLGNSVSLTPGSGFAGYYWNGSFNPGNPTFLASDTGTYIVRVKNDLGCYNGDTIRVMQRPAPVLDETNLNIAPTTCNGITGAITGLQVVGELPFSYEWTASGTPLSNSLDIYHLEVGLYELSVTDGFGCSNTMASYAISDAGEVLIETALATPAYCGNADGTLSITAVSGLGSMLQYFIKTGNDTLSQWSNGLFSNLPGGTYYAWVSDSSGCSSVYPTSLQIAELTAPEVVSATSTPETGNDADGTITIIATGSGLSYSLNGISYGGISYFSNLAHGDYTIVVSNPYGCDTTFTVTVGQHSGIRLAAIAGNGSACLGKVAQAPLVVSNFRDVQSFDASLNYEKNYVTCTGYIPNPLPQLADSLEVMLFPATGIIRASWKGASSLTLPDSTELLQLVFNSVLPGNALLLWDMSPAISNFFGPGGDTLNVDYTLGSILISNPPDIMSQSDTRVCEGDLLWLSPIVQYGTGPLSYEWETPIGSLSGQESIFKTATLADDGRYELIATDTIYCADTSSMRVTVVPTPVSGFTSDTVYFDEQTHLEAAQGYNSYAWNTGDSTYTILVTSEGWYKVTMKTPEGCTSTDSIMMLYSFAPFTLPNAFSPNGDGKNEVFRPVTVPEKISSFTMYIYNRWGQQVYATKDLGTGWDGTINGSPAPMGVYTFIISYSNAVGESRKKNGTVTLVR